MTFVDPVFINSLIEELKRRNYAFIEMLDILDSSDAFYKVFSQKR